MGQKREQAIPKAPVGRLLMQSGAKRVAQDAVDAFTEVVEHLAEEIGKKAVENAKHAGRKTVHESDIRLAAKME